MRRGSCAYFGGGAEVGVLRDCPYGNIGKKRVKLTVVKVVVSSEGTCNNCLFVKVFNYFLKCSNEIFGFLASNS